VKTRGGISWICPSASPSSCSGTPPTASCRSTTVCTGTPQVDGDLRDTAVLQPVFPRVRSALFQPNRMKNDLEEARLNLEKSELKYQSDVVAIIDDLSTDYYDLVSDAYKREAAEAFMEDLDAAIGAARDVAGQTRPDGPAKANCCRWSWPTRGKPSTRRPATSAIANRPSSSACSSRSAARSACAPVSTWCPWRQSGGGDPLRIHRHAPCAAADIGTRENEIRLQETRGNNAFRMNLGLTYGRRGAGSAFSEPLGGPRNSYTVEVNATVPIGTGVSGATGFRRSSFRWTARGCPRSRRSRRSKPKCAIS